MSRSSVIGTGWQEAWGTAGTHAMQPSPHIEGLGSFAGRLDDRLSFLFMQQTDNVFSEHFSKSYTPGENAFQVLDQYRIYNGGQYPQIVFGFNAARSGAPLGVSGTFSVNFGGLDLGTISVVTGGATTVEWYIDLPAIAVPHELTFCILAASGDTGHFLLKVYGCWLAFLPTRLF